MKTQMHIPVMLSEVIETFDTLPKGFFLDATLGDGGHAENLLLNHEQIQLIGLDRDAEAIKRAEQRLARFANRIIFVNACFGLLDKELDKLGITELTGALFDLGVSSNHLDNPERGFSFRNEGKLDMRMDLSQTFTAADIVNDWSQEDIANVLYEYGQERNSRRIAASIVASRPINTTLELTQAITKTIKFSKRIHPARRTFQALRIYVNQELEQIAPALTEVKEHLVPGGRVVVLSYHSGEDRIVKNLLRDWEESSPDIVLRHRKVKKPGKTELEENPRSRSVRLRSFEKV